MNQTRASIRLETEGVDAVMEELCAAGYPNESISVCTSTSTGIWSYTDVSLRVLFNMYSVLYEACKL